MNKLRVKIKKGDWHWIEKPCGVILPLVPFRKMVFFLSEFLEFWIFGETQLGRQPGHSWQGPFFSKKRRPLSKKHVYCCFGVLFLIGFRSKRIQADATDSDPTDDFVQLN